MDILLDSKITDLKEIMEDMKEFLNESTLTRIRRVIENADYSQPDARKKLISYLKPILYNNKEMIIKTRKNIGSNNEDLSEGEDSDAENPIDEI